MNSDWKTTVEAQIWRFFRVSQCTRACIDSMHIWVVSWIQIGKRQLKRKSEVFSEFRNVHAHVSIQCTFELFREFKSENDSWSANLTFFQSFAMYTRMYRFNAHLSCFVNSNRKTTVEAQIWSFFRVSQCTRACIDSMHVWVVSWIQIGKRQLKRKSDVFSEFRNVHAHVSIQCTLDFFHEFRLENDSWSANLKLFKKFAQNALM